MKALFFTCFSIAVTLPVAAQSPLGAYQVILDKSLLGRVEAPPSPVSTPPPPPAAPPGWASEYRMTMITKDDYNGQVRIGLQNIRDNSGRLLMADDPPDNAFRLLDADFERNQATVSYQGSSHVFSLESGSPPAAADTSPTPGRGQPPGRRRVVSPTPPPAPTPVPTAAPAEEAPRFRTQEELDAHLKEVQMDAIRTGKPPLPIPLTPEMDAQLVREGVLPPPGTP